MTSQLIDRLGTNKIIERLDNQAILLESISSQPKASDDSISYLVDTKSERLASGSKYGQLSGYLPNRVLNVELQLQFISTSSTTVGETEIYCGWGSNSNPSYPGSYSTMSTGRTMLYDEKFYVGTGATSSVYYSMENFNTSGSWYYLQWYIPTMTDLKISWTTRIWTA